MWTIDETTVFSRTWTTNSFILFKQQTHSPSTVTFDLADRHTVDRAAEEILKCYGHVDVLINNAGISFRGKILDTSVSVQREVMETNYFGPVALTQGQLALTNRIRIGPVESADVRENKKQRCSIHPLTVSCLCPLAALLPSMVARRSGHIVAISSVQGKIAIPYRSACKLPPFFRKSPIKSVSHVIVTHCV